MKREKKIVNAERGKYEEEITDQKKRWQASFLCPWKEGKMKNETLCGRVSSEVERDERDTANTSSIE